VRDHVADVAEEGEVGGCRWNVEEAIGGWGGNFQVQVGEDLERHVICIGKCPRVNWGVWKPSGVFSGAAVVVVGVRCRSGMYLRSKCNQLLKS